MRQEVKLKKRKFLWFLIAILTLCCGCGSGQETDGLKDAGKIISEETVAMIHGQSEPVIRETATASGVRAQLTELQPLILYVSAPEDEITQLYDVYKATFTTTSGYQTERYMVAYYRNVHIEDPLSETAVINSEPPICVGAMVEVGADAQEAGYIFGYKSRQDMEADVLRSMDTGITHQMEK